MRLIATPFRFKWVLSLYPPLWGTGIWVDSVSDDFREVEVSMSSRFYNHNAFGDHFGGSLAAMTDPFLTLMLMNVLGPDYRVIDSETRIRFLERAQGKVTARFLIEESDLDRIRGATAGGEKHFEDFRVEVRDDSGQTVVEVVKRIYIRLRRDLRPPAAS